MVGASPVCKGAAMNTGLLITILVIVVIVVLLAVLLGQRRRRTQRLQQQFGPEYQRTVARTGDQRTAEADLAAREQRRREFNIVALEPAARDRYLETWRATQGRFVDDPAGTTREADILVAQVMRDRGYPGGRLRTAGRRRLGRPPPGGRELPRRPCDLPGQRTGAGQHR